jgi:flagellar motility protein MotE (MotC chaperone)
MKIRSIKSFEQRWAKLRKLASAQLKDFEKDKNDLAKAIKRHKVAKDVETVREMVAHQKRVVQVIKGTKALIKTKDQLMREGKRRGKLLKRALT